MLPMNEPQFNFKWLKQGVPGINTLSNANCLLIIKDNTTAATDGVFKQYFRLSEVRKENFTEENYQMIVDVFTYPINSLWVMKLDPLAEDALTDEDDDKFILIENENIDYGVYPDAEEEEIAIIKDEVKKLRDKLHPIKWIFEGSLTSNLDAPYFIQFLAEEMFDEEGEIIPVEKLLPTIMAQRASCPFTQSLTYKAIGKVKTAKRLRDVDGYLGNGIMTLIKVNKRWVYARDINSLTTLGDQYDERFRQNQRMAVMDSIVKDIKNSWQTYWVGNYQNNAKNKNAFSAACNVYICKRGRDLTDPVENGFFELDLEKHKDVLRLAGKSEEYIRSLNLAQIENVDTGTDVYIKGKVQINGIMEDITFEITAAVDMD